eukprot:sb/3464315/
MLTAHDPNFLLQQLKSEVQKFAVIRVDNSHIQRVNEGRKALIIVGFTVLEQLDTKIGEPTKLDPMTVKEEVPAPVHNNNSMTSPQMRNGSTGGLAGMAPSASQVQPITSLNPYQNKWLIKARVSKKSDIRTWSNARGEGKLFSMELCDESGEIRCTGFTEAVDRFYNVVEQGKVYYISRCNLKTANKQYTNVKNDYEMQMTNDTSIVRAEDDDSVPEVKMNYTQIADIDKVEPNAFVDIAGVATQISEITNITSRAGKELTKREIKIQDKSGAAINLTLWGNDAINFDNTLPEPVVAVKGAKVSDFGGRTVSVSFNSTLMVNPDTQHSHELKGWYMKEGRNQDVRQMTGSQSGGGGAMETAVKSFVDAKASISESKPEYFSNTCVLTFLKKDNCMYKACPSADCNKKVTQEGESEYRCEKCNRSYPNFDHRLMMNAKFADASGVEWITLFQESAEKLLGKTSSGEKKHDRLRDPLI